jgi:hypothetical protein
MPEGVNRRWPHTRRLVAARQQLYCHLRSPVGLGARSRWPDSEDSAGDGAGGPGPSGWPSPPAADETPQGLGAVGCPKRGRRSVVVDVPVTTTGGISAPVSASNLDNRGFGFAAELAAEAAFAAGTTIAIAAKPRILEPLQAYPHRTTLTVAQRPEIADHLGAIGDRAGRAPFTHRP